MKKISRTLILGLGLALASASCSKKLHTRKPALASHQDSVAYAFGVLNSGAFSEVVSRMPGDSLSRQQILSGFSDAFLGEHLKISAADAQSIFEAYASDLRAQETRRRTASADSVIAAYKGRDGVKSTESGLMYRVLRAAQEERPSAQDTVVVHYTGRLTDGKEFDSSIKRGEPAVFPLSQVIAGWTEGICLMTKGSKYEFLIPASLAYGERGVNGVIPPGAPLFFEVELLDIRPYREAKAEVKEDSSAAPAKATPSAKGHKPAKRKK